METIIEECSLRYPMETGGILVGRFKEEQAEIVEAIGPGPNAQHASHFFKRDGQFAQTQLDLAYEKFVGQYDYVGEWHSHCAVQGPSSTDIQSIAWISTNASYRQPHPLLLIPQYHPQTKQWQCVIFQWQSGKLKKLTLVDTKKDTNL
jgi:integrative and conjugative element protein (TIGR02256 family)